MMRNAVILLVLASSAEAAIYKCDVGGKSVFQDKPCAGAARDDHQVEVKGAKPAAVNADANVDVEPSTAAPAAGSAAKSQAEWLAERDQINQRRELENKIKHLEARNVSLRTKLDIELKMLDIDAGRAANNLAGATWLQSIATEKQALVTAHEVDAAANRSQIERLQRQLDELD